MCLWGGGGGDGCFCVSVSLSVCNVAVYVTVCLCRHACGVRVSVCETRSEGLRVGQSV